MSVLSDFLSETLNKKQAQNPSYSLRSFARDLELDPSSLSKIINGKRIPDMITVQSILTALNEDADSIKKICARIEQEKNIKDFKLSTPKKEYTKTPELIFKIISDPIHYTFLELIKLNDGILDHDFYCKKLKVDNEKLLEVIKNLVEVGLIEITENYIKDLTAGFSSHEIGLEQTNKANKSYQKSLLDLSKSSIENVSIEYRDHSAILFATNHKKIFEAKGIVKKFRQSLCDFLEDVDDKDSVYALHVGLFPLTKDKD
ncbi:MAG: TIGR02147 family protein [Bacteriovoracaceae bacterium]|nr:TIGR02147 family protein [Bacteriovoracaceae bacterium]